MLFYANDAEAKNRVKAEMQATVAKQTKRTERMTEIATSDEDKRLFADSRPSAVPCGGGLQRWHPHGQR